MTKNKECTASWNVGSFFSPLVSLDVWIDWSMKSCATGAFEVAYLRLFFPRSVFLVVGERSGCLPSCYDFGSGHFLFVSADESSCYR